MIIEQYLIKYIILPQIVLDDCKVKGVESLLVRQVPLKGEDADHLV